MTGLTIEEAKAHRPKRKPGTLGGAPGFEDQDGRRIIERSQWLNNEMPLPHSVGLRRFKRIRRLILGKGVQQ
jgi:hypothetical protein